MSVEKDNKGGLDVLTVNGRNAVLDYRQFHLSYDPLKNKTSPLLNKFMLALILGKRATQIAAGAPAMIIVPDGITDVKEIAKLELKAKKTPYIVEVDVGNGHLEYWRIRDMVVNID